MGHEILRLANIRKSWSMGGWVYYNRPRGDLLLPASANAENLPTAARILAKASIRRAFGFSRETAHLIIERG